MHEQRHIFITVLLSSLNSLGACSHLETFWFLSFANLPHFQNQINEIIMLFG